MSVRNEISIIKSSWFIWIFPVFAVILCGWLLYTRMAQQGPTITIAFEDGGSLQPEKTRIRYRGVAVGVVKKVELSDDGKNVLATAVLEKTAEHFAVKGSKFWIVSPKVTFQGVSGLETLIEGNYISAQPGKPDGEEQFEFDGKVDNEASDVMEDTVAYHLEAKNVESVNVGDSVTFRGLKIGSVSRVNLSKTSQTVLVQISVESKFAKVIRTNTVFWRKVAVNANLGLFNSEVKINSLDSILRGGIELFTPDNPGEMAKARSKFALSENPPKGWEKWNPVLEFPEK